MSGPNELERALARTAYLNPQLRGKIRKVPREAWSDPVARDFVIRMISNQPILDAHIQALGPQVLEPSMMQSATDEVTSLAYIRQSESYARNILNQVQLGDLDAIHKAMDERPNSVGMGGGEHLSEIVHSVLEMARAGIDDTVASNNVKIPIPRLQDAWGGIAGGSLHVLGGDPGGAKSALVEQINLLTGAPENPARVNVGDMSMEMPKEFKMMRYAQHLYGPSVGPKAVLSGKADMDLLGQALKELQQYSIFVDSNKYQRYGLVDAMYAMKDQFDITYFTIDFLQLMMGFKGESKYDNTSSNIMAIFEAGRQMNTGIVLLSQLNREGRKLAERPRMTDLEGAGTIEQLAWTCSFLWDKDRLTSTKGSNSRTLVMDKDRNGAAPVELGPFAFDGPFMQLDIK